MNAPKEYLTAPRSRLTPSAVALMLIISTTHAQSPAPTLLPTGASAIDSLTLRSITTQQTTIGGGSEAAAVAPTPSARPTPPTTAAAQVVIDPDATVIPPSAPPASAPAVDAIWQGNPLPVALKVGVERRIDFPEHLADIDIPQAVGRQSRVVLSPTGELHWLAQAPFASARVLATAVSGTLYQLDVSAQAEGHAPERLVVRDPLMEATTYAKNHAPTDRAKLEAAAGALIPDFLQNSAPGAGGLNKTDYAALARFALAHYTGPARLIPKLEATPVEVRAINVRAWVRLPVTGLTIKPLKQWKAGNLHVTALGVYNGGSQVIPFEPKALRGRLLFAAALHPTLQPAGSGHNGTVWAIVTEPPFQHAVLPHADPLTLPP